LHDCSELTFTVELELEVEELELVVAVLVVVIPPVPKAEKMSRVAWFSAEAKT